jgi:hypothetical protein
MRRKTQGSVRYVLYCIYFFSSLAASGGGATLNSSGRFGLVPSPTCSHGESDSKLLGPASAQSWRSERRH